MQSVILFVLSSLGAASDAPVEVPPIVIRGQSQAEATAPSTVLGRRHFTLGAATDLSGALSLEPGLRLTRLGGLGDYATVSVRGSTPEQVTVLLDGIPLNGADGAPVDLGSLPLGPVESIAIWKGSSPLELGGSAIGGAVDLTTRVPPRGVSVDAAAGGGSFGTRVARLYAGVGGSGASAAVSLDYVGSENDFTFTSDRGTLLVAGDDEELTRTNAAFDRLSLLVRGAARLGGGASVRATSLTQLDDRGLPGIGLYTTRRAHLREVRHLTGLSLRWAPRVSLNPQLALEPWASLSRTELSDPLGELGLLVPTGTRDRLWATGARLTGSLSADAWGLTWVPRIAVVYRHDEFAPADAGLAGAPSTRDGLVAGGELGVTWAAAEDQALTLSAGGRAELLWNDLTGRNAQPGEAVHRDAGELSDGSARAALRYRLDGLEAHAAFVRSLRFPSLFELFGNTGAVLGNPDLVPESAMGGELGAGWRQSFGREHPVQLTVSVEGHLTRARNLILLVPNGQDVARAENVAGAWLYGAELGVGVSLAPVTVSLGATWLEATNASSAPARDGKTLPGRSRFSGTARVEGRWAPPGVALSLWSELEALGPSPLDYANTTVAEARWWWSVGAGADLLQGRLRLRVDVRNLLSMTTRDVLGYPLPGLTALATLGWVQ